jgi:hypothetical protein
MYPVATRTFTDTTSGRMLFSNIPQGYDHLQLRVMARSTYATGNFDWLYMFEFNGTGGGNFSGHLLYGDGSSVYSNGNAANAYSAFLGYIPNANVTSNMFGLCIIDILDYSSTTKIKNIKTVFGFDANGSGQVGHCSGASPSVVGTNPITALTVGVSSPQTFAAGTKMELYAYSGYTVSGA